MAQNVNQFLISVADAFLVDKDSDVIALKAKTLMSSSLSQSVQELVIKGGFGDKTQFIYNYGKELSATLEDGRWDEGWLAINSNALISTEAKDIWIVDEMVTLSGGAGTVKETPVGNLYVQKSDNTFVTITPTTKNFNVDGGGSTTVKVTYKYSTTVDNIIIGADDFPKAYRLVMKAKLFQTASGQSQTGDLEIIIENFKPSGNFEINLGASTAATSKLEGKALVATNTSGEDYYAEVRIKPLSGSAIKLVSIAISPSTCELDLSEEQTQQLTVIGIQGGLKANITNPSGTTFESSDTGIATVNSNGLITPIAVGTCTITATNGALTDVCNVEVVN